MDSYTILCTELRGSAQSLNGNIDTLQKKADKLQKAISKVTRGDYKTSDLSSAYTAQTALTGSITRLGEICGAMNTAALQFSEASTELSGRANLTAYYMQHTDTLSYEGLMGTYTAAIASAGSAAAGYELVKSTLEENGYSVSSLGSVSNAVQDAIQREAEEQAKRAEEAKWAKIGLTGLVIVGGIVASVVTGGAAAPIVIGAISGAVMAGGNTAIDQYAEHGWDTDNWDYAEIGKDAFVGGVTGAATAWVGGNLTKGFTNLASSTQWGSTLLNSSNAYVRVGTGAFIGSASEVVSGMGSRGTGAFISTMIETDGDLGKSLSDAADYAFDGKEIAQDAVLGGLQGGSQQHKEWKTEQIAAERMNAPIEKGPYEPNGVINEDGMRYRTDDNGNKYMSYNSDTKNWEGLPDTVYEREGYRYITDDQGRIYMAEGDLRLSDAERKSLNATVDGMLEGDDRGHIIADRFAGSNKNDNLAGQASSVNRSGGEYFEMEEMFAETLQNKGSVHSRYVLNYTGSSVRPNGTRVEYEIHSSDGSGLGASKYIWNPKE